MTLPEVITLREILNKREEIMNKNKGDEYIDIPGGENTSDRDTDDRSTKEIYRNEIQYNIAKNLHHLTDTIKVYLDKERTRKIKWEFCRYLSGLVIVSGMLVLNDYILLTYFN